MKSVEEMPGHLVRRFQQVAVAIFHAEVGQAGSDITPVQYAALVAISTNPGIDQVTLAGLIAYDRTTITGVVDRLVHKGLIVRNASATDRRARALHITSEGHQTLDTIAPAVEEAQEIMLRGLSQDEQKAFMHLLQKAIGAVNDLSRAPMRAASKGTQRDR